MAADKTPNVTLKWTYDRHGNWSLLPFKRYIDAKGARADRPVKS